MKKKSQELTSIQPFSCDCYHYYYDYQYAAFNKTESESKTLLGSSVSMPEFGVASSGQQAESVAVSLAAGDEGFVVKADIVERGRTSGNFENGLVGGVQRAGSPAEVRQVAEKMLGQKLVTAETPAGGVAVKQVIVSKATDCRVAFYLSMKLDERIGVPVIVFSPAGGENIADIAAQAPELIAKWPIDPKAGLSVGDAEHLAYKFGFTDWKTAGEQLRHIYQAFVDNKCTELEINPWGQSRSADVFALDARIQN
jgi:succinyl-CoA synthetase beta subunit